VTTLLEHTLPPKTGFSLTIASGEYLKITDLEGKQSVDMVLFNAAWPRERLSTSYTRTRYRPEPGAEYVKRDHISQGSTLMSSICNPMMTLTMETPVPKGVHSLHNRMCNSWNYVAYGLEPRDGCLELLAKSLARFDLLPEDIPDSMDIFMNCHHDCDGRRWVTEEPVTRPGDYIVFRAEMDCIVGLSNCPQDALNACNGFRCTPVRVEVFDADPEVAA